jgi:hypothetical protein
VVVSTTKEDDVKRILGASLVSCLALAGPAGATDRCQLGERPGAEVLVRYPVPDHAQPFNKHRVDHIPYTLTSTPGVTVAGAGLPLSSDSPRVIGVGDFMPGGPCDLLWEEADPDHPTEHPQIRVAVTEGFTAPQVSTFEQGVPRPPLPWDVAGVFDLTDDLRADVLWWNPATGEAVLWVGTDTGWTEAAVAGAPLVPESGTPPRRPSTAIARLEAGGRPGIVWHPSLNSPFYRYLRTTWDGQQLKLHDAGVLEGIDASGFLLVAVGDFDDDGHDDLLQERFSDEHLFVCLLGGPAEIPCRLLVPPTFQHTGYTLGWEVAGPR